MSMKDIVSLCKRRGFVFPSSEIYGGLNGFWDYGPLGAALKRNVRAAWWDDMITHHNRLVAPEGAPSPFEMTGIDSSIIMHPQVWRASGHYDLFHDTMVDCRETKRRYRFDHLRGRWVAHRDRRVFVALIAEPEDEQELALEAACTYFKLRRSYADQLTWEGEFTDVASLASTDDVLAPGATAPGTLTAPRDFNLMLETGIGAAASEDSRAFLRPETAQGIFVNFRNVLDTTRARLPLGIGQIGKSFRNEITPRNFTFRSREFEQMECEFFCHPDTSQAWYRYWRDRRYAWYRDLGLAPERLRAREHDQDELSHYSIGTCDIEYAFPFLPEGEFGELEGVAHRGDFDLRSHMEGKLDPKSRPLVVERDERGQPRHPGSGKNLSYRDDATGQTYIPHVIEPAAGCDRATLAFICEAYQIDRAPDDQGRPQERTVMRLHRRLAPVKAAILPLVKKDGMPEIARELYGELRRHVATDYDEKDAVGRRYRRQDEIGTPFCITIDSQTLTDRTVTIRDRDTLVQDRIRLDDAAQEVRNRLL
jgi:glycyl-tRNA synthetase